MAELPAPKAGEAPALVIDGGSALFEATREFRAAEWGTVDRFLSLCEAEAPLPLWFLSLLLMPPARPPRAQHKEELTRRRGQAPGCLEGAAASEDAMAALDASVAAAAAGCLAAVAARRDALLHEARARAAEAAAALRARNEAAFEAHVREIPPLVLSGHAASLTPY